MKSKQLTIILVAGNRPKEYTQTIQSLKRQSHKNFSLVIGDDSGNPEIKKITYSYITPTLYKQNVPPLGEIMNTNNSVALSKSEWCCLLHDDDYLDTKFVEIVLQTINTYHNADLIYTGRIILNEKGEKIASQQLLNGPKIIQYKAGDVLKHLLFVRKLSGFKISLMTPGLIFRTSLFKKVGGLNKSINTHYDIEMIYKLLTHSKDVILINKPLYHARVWYGQSGRTKSSSEGKPVEALLSVINSTYLYCKKNKYPLHIRYKSMIKNIVLEYGISMNGPLTWITLRFKGNYIKKNIIIINNAVTMIRINSSLIKNMKFIAILIINILSPQWLFKIMQRLSLAHYQEVR